MPSKADITVLPDGSVGPVVGLEQALALAQPGETLYLMPGEYAGVTIDGQAVRIVGAGRDLVTVGTLSGSTEASNLVVRNLERDQSVLVAGVTLDQGSPLADGVTLTVDSCEGLVVVQDCDVIKSQAINPPSVTFLCENSSAIVLDHCLVRGFEAPAGTSQQGGTAARPFLCQLDLNHCEVIGGFGTSSSVFRGEPALLVDNSVLRVHGGLVQGGNAFATSGTNIVAAAAIDVALSDLSFSGGPGTLVQGGSVLPSGNPAHQGGAAMIAFGGSVTLYGGAAFEPGVDGAGEPEPKWFPDGITDYIRAFGGQHRPGLSVTPPSGAPGASYELGIQGTPGRLQTIVAGRELAAPFNLAGYAGLSYLDPSQPFDLFSATTDGNGVASMQISTPAIPELIGQFTWYQSFEIQDPDGRPLLGLPTGYRFM